MTINAMSFDGVLIDAEGMVIAMIALGNQMQIFYRVVGSVLIDMVNIVPLRYRPIMKLPDIAVKHCPTALGLSVIAIIAKVVTKSIERHEWQWRGAVAELPATSVEKFIDRLTAHTEGFADLRQAIALLVERVHFGRLFVFALPNHEVILPYPDSRQGINSNAVVPA